jgi:hypothetical protein
MGVCGWVIGVGVCGGEGQTVGFGGGEAERVGSYGGGGRYSRRGIWKWKDGGQSGIGWVDRRRSGRGCGTRMVEDEEDRVAVVEEKEVVRVNAGRVMGRGCRGGVHNMSKLCHENEMQLTLSLISQSSMGQASIHIS